jgi:Glutamate-cysteine ligase family 2(GCS2)
VTLSTTAARDGPAQGRVPHLSVTERTARGKGGARHRPAVAPRRLGAVRRAARGGGRAPRADRGSRAGARPDQTRADARLAVCLLPRRGRAHDRRPRRHAALAPGGPAVRRRAPRRTSRLRRPRPRAQVRHRRLRRDRPRTLGVGRQAAAASIAIAGRELGLASAVRRDARGARTHRPASQGEGAARPRRNRPSRPEQLKRKALAQSQTDRRRSGGAGAPAPSARRRAAGQARVARRRSRHPSDGTHSEVAHSTSARDREIDATMRALAPPRPTMARHVHIAVPDGATAVRALDGLRSDLPLLVALSGNSRYWRGSDSGSPR